MVFETGGILDRKPGIAAGHDICVAMIVMITVTVADEDNPLIAEMIRPFFHTLQTGQKLMIEDEPFRIAVIDDVIKLM